MIIYALLFVCSSLMGLDSKSGFATLYINHHAIQEVPASLHDIRVKCVGSALCQKASGLSHEALRDMGNAFEQKRKATFSDEALSKMYNAFEKKQKEFPGKLKGGDEGESFFGAFIAGCDKRLERWIEYFEPDEGTSRVVNIRGEAIRRYRSIKGVKQRKIEKNEEAKKSMCYGLAIGFGVIAASHLLASYQFKGESVESIEYLNEGKIVKKEFLNLPKKLLNSSDYYGYRALLKSTGFFLPSFYYLCCCFRNMSDHHIRITLFSSIIIFSIIAPSLVYDYYKIFSNIKNNQKNLDYIADHQNEIK